MSTKVTKADLQEKARMENIDPNQSYTELRSEIEIHTCKWCSDEFLHDMWDGFCTDQCQTDYINEYYR